MHILLGFTLSALIGTYFVRIYRIWVGIAEVLNNRRRAVIVYTALSALLIPVLHIVAPNADTVLWLTQVSILSIFFAVLLVDIDTMYIPDALSFPLIAFSIVARLHDYTYGLSMGDVYFVIAPGVMAYIAFVAIDVLHLKVTGRHGLGRGDAKLFAGIAILVGAFPALVVLVVASFASVVHHLILRLMNKELDYIPFGPPLVAATVAVWLWQLSVGTFGHYDLLSPHSLAGL